MDKPKFVLSFEKSMFDRCYTLSDQQELQSILELVGGIPLKEEYRKEWLLQNIKKVEGCITGWGSIPFDNEILDEAKALKILFHTAGTIRSCYGEAIKRNLRIVTNARINAIPVAEFTLGLILSGLKGVYQYQKYLRNKKKKGWGRNIPISLGYYKTTIGIISIGHIGQKLLDILQHFDFNILVYSNHFSEEEARKFNARKVSLDEIMSGSDAVVLLAPAYPKNRHLINERLLSLMKDNSIFINVSRGMLVDENALVKELKRGRITAFLDVTEPEPPEEGHPFYTLPNCILTPHIAGSLGSECYRLGKATVEEIKHYLEGNALKGEISRDEFSYRA